MTTGAAPRRVGVRNQRKAPTASRLRQVLAWAALLVVLTFAGVGLGVSQQQARDQLNKTFQTRADIARQFVASYVHDVLGREQSVGAEQLAGPTVSDTQFRAVVQSFGFSAAVILDSAGRALDIWPAAPAKIGTNLAAKYAHLQSAEQGTPTVSHVVQSAALSRPVVAFAVPFDTPFGRRVLSGGFDVNATPVASYLNNSLPQAGAAIYLVDRSSGVVVADKAGPTPNAAPLTVQAPQLGAAASASSDGSFTDAGGEQYCVEVDVINSPWRIVMSVPDATLYAALDGSSQWAPWAIFLCLALAAVVLGRLMIRLQDGRRQLAATNADLVEANNDLALLARIDKLTGVYNRRHLEEQIDIVLHAAARDAAPLSVLMLDVDHFKAVNDIEGHEVGDRALQCMATAIRMALRPGDVFGRWGGEEFLVLLPGTAADGAQLIGERLRSQVADTLVSSDDGRRLPMTVSVGVAVADSHDVPGTLVARADAAMYRAKSAGRNRVAA